MSWIRSTLTFQVLLMMLISSHSVAREITMAFSQDIPPYIFQDRDAGIEIEVISAALAHKGHVLKAHYFPLARIPIAFQEKSVDAVMGDMGVDLLPHGGFYGNPAVVYDNVFLALSERKLIIQQPSDLDGLSVVSFQGAEKRYPKWLGKVLEEGRFYGIGDQQTQVKLLKLKRYDLVLSDRFIFKYFANVLKAKGEIEAIHYQEHHFVEADPADYRPVFRDQGIRNDFNEGLKVIKENGQYQSIYQHYFE